MADSYQIIETITAHGKTIEVRWAAGSSPLNQAQLLDAAVTALAGNATFLAIASPTTAQAITQVKALTRQVDALIRLAANQLDTTSGT